MPKLDPDHKKRTPMTDLSMHDLNTRALTTTKPFSQPSEQKRHNAIKTSASDSSASAMGLRTQPSTRQQPASHARAPDYLGANSIFSKQALHKHSMSSRLPLRHQKSKKTKAIPTITSEHSPTLPPRSNTDVHQLNPTVFAMLLADIPRYFQGDWQAFTIYQSWLPRLSPDDLRLLGKDFLQAIIQQRLINPSALQAIVPSFQQLSASEKKYLDPHRAIPISTQPTLSLSLGDVLYPNKP